MPYSTNINVGHLLHDDWLVDEWNYNFRQARLTGGTTQQPVYETQYTYKSGSVTNGTTYLAASCPARTVRGVVESQTTAADGWTHQEILETGMSYNCAQADANTFRVTPVSYDNH